MSARIPCPTCGAHLAVLAPAAVVAYLERRGWIECTAEPLAGKWLVFARGRARIEVPMMAHAIDYPRRWVELLSNLMLVEGRPMAEILDEMMEHR